ncbi:hypothetical protein HPP92_001312 [Vanilla planifolia]|uniref:Phospholipase n=1 Tax=Vanilla planifolia TaxID=51239 RepID=A0A835RXX9_VANPL|nr:hypothetical protein HPP92_001312 [Vanilla planifolia]
MRSESAATSSSGQLHRQLVSTEPEWIFDELPKATIVSVSRPDVSDITPMLLSYTIEFQYKQFKWTLTKKASQVVYLHFALKKRAFIEEFIEKQEQVKEWVQNLGLGETTAVVQDDDEGDDDFVHLQHEENVSARNRSCPRQKGQLIYGLGFSNWTCESKKFDKKKYPSRAALPIIRPALGRQSSISDRAKVAMQGYLNHFLGNLDVVNSPEVCKFLEVSRLSFLPEYGPKLKEEYVTVKHLPKITKHRNERCCCACNWFSCCNDNWQKVWAVLKPGFLALLEDPFDTKPLDIIVFDVLPPSERNQEGRPVLAKETKEPNPLRFGFTVSCGSRTINLRVKSNGKVKDWVAAINEAGLKPPEGWCYPHRFGSFAPQRGLFEDGSQVQWFIDGKAAFDAIASSIEEAKSEIFITDWWLCPELYLRRPFPAHGTSRLDSLLEARAKQGVQIYILLYKEVAIALKINSVYSKRRLLNIHENVKVLRYPDHFSTGVYLWESEPNSWEDTMKDELDRTKYPRMPWHDVHCALWGPPCRDVARHFVQRWNFAKRSKALHEETIPLLMPHHHMVIPHYMGPNKEVINDSKPQTGNLRVKRQESLSSRSSYQDIPLLLPQEPDGLDKASRNPKGGTSHNPAEQPSKPNHSAFHFRKSKVELAVPDMQMKDFVNDIDSSHIQGYKHNNGIAQMAYLSIDKEWWEAQERGDQGASPEELGQVGPRTTCHCQGGIDDSGAASVRALLHCQYRTICRGQNSILQNLYDVMGPKAQEYISFYGLRSYGRLHDSGRIATSQIYVHSKLMIVDDRMALIGSANINDRSLLGSRDSEIGIVIEDKEFVSSSMSGNSWNAGKFSLSLRLSLWSEHLGLHFDEITLIRDPVAEATYKDIWMATAKVSSMQSPKDFFSIRKMHYMFNQHHDLSRYLLLRAKRSHPLESCLAAKHRFWKEKLGHTTIDLGIAPEKLESYQNGDLKDTDPIERLQSVRGHLVSFPLDFMCQEDLRPVFNESEFYASQVFY